MSDLTLIVDNERDNKLRKVSIQVCDGCLERRAGECHMPGCVFYFFEIDQVPDLTHQFEIIGEDE